MCFGLTIAYCYCYHSTHSVEFFSIGQPTDVLTAIATPLHQRSASATECHLVDFFWPSLEKLGLISLGCDTDTYVLPITI